ncbi:hypothetical protein PF007_g25577 [Phytophthora fragariae]|uniref:Uncharacterized protein n=1 Tax=Phytophthora fragariae TaxID=53985 RepID=A0A6A3QDP1_9STRA|nr:hypothetical protein PF007_g25577 [Phytophthora fragariae]
MSPLVRQVLQVSVLAPPPAAPAQEPELRAVRHGHLLPWEHVSHRHRHDSELVPVWTSWKRAAALRECFIRRSRPPFSRASMPTNLLPVVRVLRCILNPSLAGALRHGGPNNCT